MVERIYEKANDQGVAKYVLYADSSNDLFTDSACTKAVVAADLFHLFLNGVVAVKDGKYYAAKTCTPAGVIDFGLV